MGPEEKYWKAIHEDGFNAEFEELVVDKVAKLLKQGVSKDTVLRFLDLLSLGKDAVDRIVSPTSRQPGGPRRQD